jgi:hypothetical protein
VSAVTDLLDRLIAGDVPLQRVAADFATRSWPSGPSDAKLNADAMSFADPEPFAAANTFAEVEAYYAQHKITDEQYAALAKAAASAM